MILYDQDFRFIGMSAETLTFLGYEDIDEFTSMHSDFADLFVKKEGFIHKFDNFSWIHYVLYSGAANKKAYLSRKNGEEICVDITIKEVFLNHAYDGLRMIYSVKLINENFTKISHSDVHDNRSTETQRNEFSLRNLTKDSSTADREPTREPSTEETTASKPSTQTVPEPLDFKLDMPEDSILGTQHEEQPTPSVKEPEQPTVPLFDLSDTDTPKEEKRVEEKQSANSDFRLNIPAMGSIRVEQEEEESQSATPAFIADADNVDKENRAMPSPLPSKPDKDLSEDFKRIFIVEEEQEEQKQEDSRLSFDLAPAFETGEQTEEEHQAVALHEDSSDPKEEESADIFSFQLLKERTEESSSERVTSPDKVETAVSDTPSLRIVETPTETETSHLNEAETNQAPKEQEPVLNFNFLQNSQSEDETTPKQEKAVEPKPQPEVKIPLHELLKPQDEKPQDETPSQQEQTEVTEAVVNEPSTKTEEKSPNTQFSFNLFKEETPQEHQAEVHQDSFHSARAEEQKTTLIDQIKQDIEEIDRDIQIQPQPDAKKEIDFNLASADHEEPLSQSENAQNREEEHKPFSLNLNAGKEMFEDPDTRNHSGEHRENSFEETLKNIFSVSQSITPSTDHSLNQFDTEKPVEKDKQHITTEAIKSPDQNDSSDTQTLTLPKLGSLGLSREEELDFIEEFLDDTAATIGLMQEYLKLEDYSNIKYNLIKISSSAEILHFDQMLEHTKALSAMSDARQKEAIGEKLHILLQLTKRYKAHFSSMPV
ncbi:MAG: hypothetical protein DSZ05_00580 [Sulfurospirillum sp.]|nr:MAG: hypothetical protein DSZ05_00580 [Sulfurospirillum sp.]